MNTLRRSRVPQPGIDTSESAEPYDGTPLDPTKIGELARECLIGDWVRVLGVEAPQKIIRKETLETFPFYSTRSGIYFENQITPIKHFEEYRGFDLKHWQVDALETYMALDENEDCKMADVIGDLPWDGCPACETHWEKEDEVVVDCPCAIHQAKEK